MQKRSKRFGLRLNQTELDALNRLSEWQGLSAAATLRRMLRETAARELGEDWGRQSANTKALHTQHSIDADHKLSVLDNNPEERECPATNLSQ